MGKANRVFRIMFVLSLLLTGLFAGSSAEKVSAASDFIWPCEACSASDITQYYGGNHYGIDLARGGTVAINATAAGTVSRSYYSDSYGEVVFIKHTINGISYETVYAHMRSGSRTVNVGDPVAQGQLLGYMGSTGDSTGQHLHFELHSPAWNISKSDSLDPLPYLENNNGGRQWFSTGDTAWDGRITTTSSKSNVDITLDQGDFSANEAEQMRVRLCSTSTGNCTEYQYFGGPVQSNNRFNTYFTNMKPATYNLDIRAPFTAVGHVIVNAY
ncbi:M23 family metallopeptidase [Desmospora activa]|uniref:Peptidase M23-like protein n=1 Tax=Desmospora activa DSM 45169 TaxID=1121389 RepID=A0A2T4ZCD0_9BACL|nr:M23 family metallopeptidase [Desmospora activa]PTM59536.1 peptidase M23-like protein [Desmospora activa DSM 45169]